MGITIKANQIKWALLLSFKLAVAAGATFLFSPILFFRVVEHFFIGVDESGMGGMFFVGPIWAIVWLLLGVIILGYPLYLVFNRQHQYGKAILLFTFTLLWLGLFYILTFGFLSGH